MTRLLSVSVLVALVVTGCAGASSNNSGPRVVSPTVASSEKPVALRSCHSRGSTAPGTATSRMVKVPVRAAHTDFLGAYDALHRAGLRVTITAPASITSLDAGSVTLMPPAGSRVRPGSTVRIKPMGGPLGSPAVSVSHPEDEVPDFLGQPLTTAIGWANRHGMFWAVPALPPVVACSAAHLFAAYRVTAEQPRAGATITQGVSVDGGFRPTFLTLTVTPT